jgi:hypothetical protein
MRSNLAIVFVAMAAVLVCLSEGVTAATLINTYTLPAPANDPYTSNIATSAHGIWTSTYYAGHLVDGSGFFGTAPNFTDTDTDGFPEHDTLTQVGAAGHVEAFLPASTSESIDKMWTNFSLPGSFDLDFMRLWNFNSNPPNPAFGERSGVKDAYIYSSNDVALPATSKTIGGASPGVGWTKVSGPGTNGIWEIAEGPNSNLYDGDSYDLSGTTARHILIDIESTWGGATTFVALSEVQFFEVEAIPEPSTLVMLTAGLLMLKVGLPTAGLLCCTWRKRK